MRISFADVFGALQPLVVPPSQTDDRFGAQLVSFLRSLARFDHCVVFAYRGQASPLDLFDTFTESERHVFVTLYQPSPFLLDPFYQAASNGRFGFSRMRELAPDRFYSSEYFRSYYVKTGLAEEVGFFVGVDDGATIALSLMRQKRSGVFPSADVGALKASEPVVAALIARHWRDVAERFPESERPVVAIRRRAANRPAGAAAWRGLSLTMREAHIVDLVLQGHSSDSIASRLAIAVGTVKVHRRNIYRKLGISSQTELLAIYIDQVARSAATG